MPAVRTAETGAVCLEKFIDSLPGNIKPLKERSAGLHSVSIDIEQISRIFNKR
jgi:hypothetical protein